MMFYFSKKGTYVIHRSMKRNAHHYLLRKNENRKREHFTQVRSQIRLETSVVKDLEKNKSYYTVGGKVS